MGVTQAAGLSLRWMRDHIGAAVDRPDESLTRPTTPRGGSRDGAARIGRRDLGAVPDGRAHAALRSRRARGAGRASPPSHTRGHVIRAVLEGVAFSLRDTFAIFAELGVPVVNVRVGGGGARSAAVAADPGRHLRPAGRDGEGGGRRRLRRRHSRRRRRRLWPAVDAACDASCAPPAEPIRTRRHRRDERALRPVHPRLSGTAHDLQP